MSHTDRIRVTLPSQLAYATLAPLAGKTKAFLDGFSPKIDGELAVLEALGAQFPSDNLEALMRDWKEIQGVRHHGDMLAALSEALKIATEGSPEGAAAAEETQAIAGCLHQQLWATQSRIGSALNRIRGESLTLSLDALTAITPEQNEVKAAYFVDHRREHGQALGAQGLQEFRPLFAKLHEQAPIIPAAPSK